MSASDDNEDLNATQVWWATEGLQLFREHLRECGYEIPDDWGSPK